MERRQVKGKTCLLLSMVVCASAQPTQGEQAHADLLGEAYAKGPVLLSIEFPREGYIQSVSISMSDASQDPIMSWRTSLPPSWRYLQTVAHDESTTTVVILAVGDVGAGNGGFFFAETGMYYLRWGIAFRDRETDPLSVLQTIEVREPRPSDAEFLIRLSDPDVLRHLFGDDVFEKRTDTVRETMLSSEGADYRALMVVSVLLESTGREWVGNIFLGKNWQEEGVIRRWGDTLLPLAKEFPESSYAPYAAYFAGCCYAVMGYTSIQESLTAERLAGKPASRIERFRRSHQLAKDDQNCARACEAFALAAKRGDAYLRPRALYQLANLRATAGDFEAADAIFDDALETAPGTGTIYDMVVKVRAGLAESREMLARETQSGQRSKGNRRTEK